SVETKFNNYVDLQVRVINGWDQVSDNNSHKSFMGRVGLYPNTGTSLGIVGYWGAEEPGNNSANRYGFEGLLWRKLGKAAVWVQGDYGTEQANAALPDPTQDAKWWALGGWVTYDSAQHSDSHCAGTTSTTRMAPARTVPSATRRLP